MRANASKAPTKNSACTVLRARAGLPPGRQLCGIRSKCNIICKLAGKRLRRRVGDILREESRRRLSRHLHPSSKQHPVGIVRARGVLARKLAPLSQLPGLVSPAWLSLLFADAFVVARVTSPIGWPYGALATTFGSAVREARQDDAS